MESNSVKSLRLHPYQKSLRSTEALKVKLAKGKFALRMDNELKPMLGDRQCNSAESKTRTKTEFSVPKSMSEISRFLMMPRYYPSHIRNYATIIKSLMHAFKVMNGKTKFSWNPEMEEAFLTSKQVTKNPVLYMPKTC